jgi:limonene-1,2-epoxide hydrolase
MSKTPIEIAEEFFALWSADRMEDALAMLSDDVFYDNVPFPDIIGRDGVRQFHIDFGFGKDWRAEFRVVNIAAAGRQCRAQRASRCLLSHERRHHHAAGHGDGHHRGRHDHRLARLFRSDGLQQATQPNQALA